MDDTIFDHALTCKAALRKLRASEPALQPRGVDAIWQEYCRLLEDVQPEILAGLVTPDQARAERFRRLVKFCGRTLGPSDAERLSRTYRSHYQAARRLVPGARHLLEWLQGRAVVAVVTNNQIAEQEEKLSHFGLRPLVDHLVVSEGVGVSKPDARIFEIALHRAGAAPANAVMLGDSWPNDILGARAAGIRAVWFNRFSRPNPEPNFVPELESLRDLRRVERLLSKRAP
jgi:putative hydrolase of the HAD superfamily